MAGNVVEAEPLPQVQVYTDGGCDPNPGPGGWGAVLVSGVHTKEISGAEPDTTNNRMELVAAINALRLLQRPCEVTLYTDSQYLRRGVTEWMPTWRAHGWRRAKGQPVENADLWQELQRQIARHRLEWRWVKGHRGDPLNERADQLASSARVVLCSGGHPPEGEEDSYDSSAGPIALPAVAIYARGCALGLPGPGGYAAVVVYANGRTQFASGGLPSATSNMMELAAAVAGLRALRRPASVTLYTTSKYVLDGATRWLASWERQGWRTKDGQPVKNKALWLELARAMGDHDVTWKSLARIKRDEFSQQAAAAARAEAEKLRAGGHDG
jgi:ribonuclease HI